MLKIIVLLKQTPKTDKVTFDWNQGRLIRDNIENGLNPDDYHALEYALMLKERYQGKITAISMGPSTAEEVLREAFTYDVDEGILLSDQRLIGSDTYVTVKALGKVIENLKPFDFIITGFETIDGGTGHLSYELAECLDIPHITQISKIEVSDNCATIDRLYGHEYQKIKTQLPILISVKRDMNQVRYPQLAKIKQSFDKPVKILKIDDIGGIPEEYGFIGSPTITIEGNISTHIRKKQIFDGDVINKVDTLIHKLKKYEILKM
jgi:electron transfer flavoprotein beta subunit